MRAKEEEVAQNIKKLVVRQNLNLFIHIFIILERRV